MTAERGQAKRGESTQRRKKMNALAKLTMADLERTFLGFDRLHNHPSSSVLDSGYPRYNVVRSGEEKYRIELALPGWNKEDIEISLQNSELTIKGKRKQEEAKGDFYIYKGLSGKCFERTFTVGEFIKIKKAYTGRGMLIIELEQELPESRRPVIIDIE